MNIREGHFYFLESIYKVFLKSKLLTKYTIANKKLFDTPITTHNENVIYSLNFNN